MASAGGDSGEIRDQESRFESQPTSFTPIIERECPSQNEHNGDQVRMPPITKIPVEVWENIVENINDPNDLVALTRTNRSLYMRVTPVLYANNVEQYDSSCIFWAARRGILQALKHAQEAGADLNMQGPIGSGDGVTTGKGTPLHFAAQGGHTHVVRWLIDQGVYLNPPSDGICGCGSSSSWTPLHTALCHRKLSVAKLLIARKSLLDLKAPPHTPISDEERSHEHALHLAAARGLVSIIDSLHSHPEFEVNVRDSNQYTALHHVAEGLEDSHYSRGIHRTILRLLGLGADIEALNDANESPLITAIRARNFGAALKLLGLGADSDPHRDNPDVGTRSLYLCALRQKEVKRFERPNAHHNGRWITKANRWARSKTRSLIRVLVNSGVEVDTQFLVTSQSSGNGTRMTAFMLACKKGNSPAIFELLKCGASVNIKSTDGKTPLNYCLERFPWSNSSIPHLLLRHGARLDLAFRFEATLLRPGILSEDIVQATTKENISRENAERLMKDVPWAEEGKEELELCEAHRLCVNLLKRVYGIPKRAIQRYLEYILEEDDYCLFQYFQDNGYIKLVDQTEVNLPNNLADPSAIYISLEAILAKALIHGSTRLKRQLMGYMGFSFQSPKFAKGQSLLHLAISASDDDTAEALIDRGADVDEFDHDLNTPLFLAIERESYRRLTLIKTLIAHGASPYTRPSDSLLEKLYPDSEDIRRSRKENFVSAFEFAISRCDLYPLKIILSMVSFPDMSQGGKHSYIHVACQQMNPRLLKWLLDKGADPNGGKGCLDPPAATILRKLWENEEKNDCIIDTTMVNLRLLLGISHPGVTKEELRVRQEVYEVLMRICEYNGDKAYQVSLREMVRQYLGVTSVGGSLTFTNEDDSVAPVIPVEGDMTAGTEDNLGPATLLELYSYGGVV